MTDAYSMGIEITAQLREGNSLPMSIAESSIRIEFPDEGSPEWHPAPHSFLGMVRLSIYRMITGESHGGVSQYQVLAELFDLEIVPQESVLLRAWRKRFNEGVRDVVWIAAYFVVKQVHDREFSAVAARPKAEVVDEKKPSTAVDEGAGREFTDEQIYRMSRLGSDHGVDGIDSDRAADATYEDTRVFELRTFKVMVGHDATGCNPL